MAQQPLVQFLGPFVEVPHASHSAQPSDMKWPLHPGGPHAASRDHDLRFETGEGTNLGPWRSRIRETVACSIVAHAAGLIALIAVPVLTSSALPHPAGVVTAFLVEPMPAPPPPPPPPPPPAVRASVTKPRVPAKAARAETFAVPVEIPTELKLEEGLDLGTESGINGGVEGGVPGGIVGGVVGGLPDALPPPPPVKPVRAGYLVKRPMKVKHVAPVYPEFAANGRLQGLVIVEAVIDERGRIARTTLLRGVPLLSGAVLEAVRQWVYTPTLFNGVPTPVTMTITVRFQLGKTSGPSVG